MTATRLRRTAALLRERAADASSWGAGRWFAVGRAVYGGTAAPHQVITPVTTYADDAAHIASLHPAFTATLAAAFDQHADVHDSGDCLHDPCAMAAAADEYLGDGA